jgi:hypothetical protein
MASSLLPYIPKLGAPPFSICLHASCCNAAASFEHSVMKIPTFPSDFRCSCIPYSYIYPRYTSPLVSLNSLHELPVYSMQAHACIMHASLTEFASVICTPPIFIVLRNCPYIYTCSNQHASLLTISIYICPSLCPPSLS